MRRACWSAAMALAGPLLAGAALVPPASAEPSLDLRHFRPPADPSGGLVLEPTTALVPGRVAVGVSTSLAERPVVLEANGEGVAIPIRHQLSLDTTAALGLGRSLTIWTRLPTVLAQRGDDLSALLPDTTPLPTAALGDVVGGVKLELWSSPSAGGIGLAAIGELTAPTGNERSFVGEGAPTATLRALAGLERPRWAVRGAMGPRLRAETSSYLGTEFGHELDWALGAVWRDGSERPGRWEGHVELHGALALAPELLGDRRSPALAAFSARRRLAALSLLAGLEAPLTRALGVPRVRAVMGLAWSGREPLARRPGTAAAADGCAGGGDCGSPDDDGDGVPDSEDACRLEPEDRDGYQDEDGCPDLDDDDDGLPDLEDACPRAPGTAADRGCPALDSDGDDIADDRDWCPASAEDRDGFQDEDGCPDLDDDGDGVPDLEDSCPRDPGTQHSGSIPVGCPSPDRDGDTFDDVIDSCPDSPEDFDGHEDDDGCPDSAASDERRPPLATLATVTDTTFVRWQRPPRFTDRDGTLVIEPASFPAVRALAQLLVADPSRSARVTVRPTATSAAAAARAGAAANLLVATLRELSHRDTAAAAAQREPLVLDAGTPPGGVSVAIERLSGSEGAP